MSPKTAINQSKPRARRKNATILPVMLASAALFSSMAGFLGVQVANGQDPMLGAAKPVVAQKNVILRKVIKTKKIVTIVDTPAAGATSTGNGAVYASTGGGGGSYSAPAQSYSAPVQSAPAPAPVQTATS
ncbi:MAG: hypothetical protein WCJ50_03850 [Actinomycetes bacterium]